MDNMKRFRVEFSGQGYPDYRPASVTMWSQDASTAEQWAKKQLAAWKADLPGVKCVVSEVKEEQPQPQSKKEQEKPKKLRDKRPATKKARKAVSNQVLVTA